MGFGKVNERVIISHQNKVFGECVCLSGHGSSKESVHTNYQRFERWWWVCRSLLFCLLCSLCPFVKTSSFFTLGLASPPCPANQSEQKSDHFLSKQSVWGNRVVSEHMGVPKKMRSHKLQRFGKWWWVYRVCLCVCLVLCVSLSMLPLWLWVFASFPHHCPANQSERKSDDSPWKLSVWGMRLSGICAFQITVFMQIAKDLEDGGG